MNIYFLLSGLLCISTAFIHLLGGGKEILKPLLINESISEDIKLTMYACWHFVTITMFVSSVLLMTGAFSTLIPTSILTVVASVYFIMSALFLYISLFVSQKKRLFAYPQWTLLLPIAILCTLGLS